ncbi:hypothetical protein JHS3_30150 [Jeongeupia sp. HS-3]|nr:hypothetical protein JHS3_30150 [Jeongeupia sp. HS-3]
MSVSASRLGVPARGRSKRMGKARQRIISAYSRYRASCCRLSAVNKQSASEGWRWERVLSGTYGFAEATGSGIADE